MRQGPRYKKREKIISIFLFKTDVSEVSSLLQDFEVPVKEIQRDTPPLCLLSQWQ